jgi:PadR family transcriptional regulator PadR
MISRELVAASSRPLILSILSQGESYGYEIIKQVHEFSGQQIDWKDGMLYPVLHRMEKEGLIESFWKCADTGRKRKYYRIQPDGKATLETQKQDWQLVNRVLDQLWGATPCLS